METAGLCPACTSSDSMRTPSRHKLFARVASMGERTSAALANTLSRSCGSGCGRAMAILTVSITNLCCGVSFRGAPGRFFLGLAAAGVSLGLCAAATRLRPRIIPAKNVVLTSNNNFNLQMEVPLSRALAGGNEFWIRKTELNHGSTLVQSQSEIFSAGGLMRI